MAFFVLIIEDGSQVAGANSYLDLAEARTTAAFFGVTLTSDDAALETNLKVAYQCLNSFESELQGSRLSDQDTSTTQTGVYPRSPVSIRGNIIGANVIPDELKYSQVIAAYANESQSILMPATASTSGAVKKEQLDGVGTIEYYEGSAGDSTTAQLSFAESQLKPLLKSALNISTGGGGVFVKSYY